MSQGTELFDNSPFATPGVVMSLLSGSCIRPAKIQEEMLEVVQGGRKKNEANSVAKETKRNENGQKYQKKSPNSRRNAQM